MQTSKGSATLLNPQFSPVEINCRIEPYSKSLYLSEGVRDDSEYKIIVLPSQNINLNDEIVYNNKSYRVKEVNLAVGLSGINHKEVFI